MMDTHISTVILAGGFGVRTNHILQDTPKALIQTADGATILSHIISDLKENGLNDVTIVTNGRFYPAISTHVHDQMRRSDIAVLNDGRGTPEDRLGALGDLLFTLDSRQTESWKESVLVLPSDTAYWESFSIGEFMEFAALHPDEFVTIVYDIHDVEKIKKKLGCAVVDDHNRIVEFTEKPEQPNSTMTILPIYVFRPRHIQLLRDFARQKGDLNSPSNIIPFLMKQDEPVLAYVSGNRVVDANGPEEIQQARQY